MPTHNTTNKASVAKNLTILCPAEKHHCVEQLAKNERRSKSQMANILLDEALAARNAAQAV